MCFHYNLFLARMGAGICILFFVCMPPGCAWKASRPAPGSSRILFVYSGAADSVCVGATFNGWAVDQDCLQRRQGRQGHWELELVVPSGRHAYGFFVNGGHFQPDPEAVAQEDDGFGRTNSVLIVP